MKRVGIGIVGAGYWGMHLIRNFMQLDDCEVKLVCDKRDSRLKEVLRLYPDMPLTSNSESMSCPEIDALVIATPPTTHFHLAKKAIELGKHVFVEKPLTTTLASAEILAKMAEKSSVKVMVGHLMIYHPAVVKLKELIDSGELGKVYYIYSQRLNLGKIRINENALWSFAPHDISMIRYLLDDEPRYVAAHGGIYLQDKIHDVVFLNLEFQNGLMAQSHLSWLDPNKIRRMTIVGSEKMAVFDDMQPSEKIRIYDIGVEADNHPHLHHHDDGDSGSAYSDALALRFGDIAIPQVDSTEPLRLECQHFLDCVANYKEPKSNAQDGLNVVRILQKAQESLESGGLPYSMTSSTSTTKSMDAQGDLTVLAQSKRESAGKNALNDGE